MTETAQSRWTDGVVFGLEDPLLEARVGYQTLGDWRRDALTLPTDGQKSLPSSPGLIVGADTFVSPSAVRQFAKAAQANARRDSSDQVQRLVRPAFGSAALCDPFGRLPRDELDRICFDLWWAPDLSRLPTGPEDLAQHLEKAAPCDVDTYRLQTEGRVDLEAAGARELALQFSPFIVGPVGHWVELQRINLLLAGALHLTDTKLGFFLRLCGGSLRALSIRRTRIGMQVNRIGRGCDVHPSAVVEFSVLEDGATVGPGAVVRGSWLGPGAAVEAQAVAELTHLGRGASVQRQAMVVGSTVYPQARVGGIVQLGLVGSRATIKMFAVGTDMNLGGPVRTPTPDGLRPVDMGYLGSCYGHDCIMGSGVWIAPGRVVPPGARLVRSADLVVRKPAQEQLTPSS